MAQDALDGKKILIVDDINDTGDTLAWLKQDWNNSGKIFTDGKSEINWEANVRFAVLTENEPSKFGDVDYVSKFINKNEDPNG